MADPNTTGVDSHEVTVDAARKQKIANLRLKTQCLENEEHIQDLYINDWSENQKNQLAKAHEKAAELLNGVERETKWNLMQTYDLPKLMRVCQLEMSPRDLYHPDMKPNLVDVLAIKKSIQERKNNHNKARVVSFSNMLENCLTRIERIEQELRVSQLDATELAAVPVQTLRYVDDAMNVTHVHAALTQTEEQIRNTLTQIEKTADLQTDAIYDGEMVLAEEQGYAKIELQERLLKLLRDKFRRIADVEAENEAFRHVYEVQRAANQQSQAIKDAKRHLKQRCEADLKQIHDAIQRADLEDSEARKKFALTKERSERYLAENLDRQAEGWRKIQDLERQLQKLSAERFEEVRRRIDDNDREVQRTVEYQQFLEVVSQQKRLLELTVYNCEVKIRCTLLMEELVADACSAIKTRHDRLAQELSDLRIEVHKEYLEFFRMLYKSLGHLIYKKEKKRDEILQNIRMAHIQLEFCVETFDPNAKKHSEQKKQLILQRMRVNEELKMLEERQAKALEDFQPTEEALIAAGIPFVDPVAEQKQEVLDRRTKMVEFRAQLTKQEELKIAAEREEIKLAKTLFQQRLTNGEESPTATGGGGGGAIMAPDATAAMDPAATAPM
eukprot:TRINITY_DN45606_c0_g1_i1.p1 TRINITY_DN45606_c0_g1~~TRINITY_DN45606_c0_g1_i1.p1  ORF type:complete len:614 (-),score=220.87 TRINITY_DN45606_c0_g1_i1:447-2288(-)